jgi:hypothetical protein
MCGLWLKDTIEGKFVWLVGHRTTRDEEKGLSYSADDRRARTMGFSASGQCVKKIIKVINYNLITVF